jgi:hypothetical protein
MEMAMMLFLIQMLEFFGVIFLRFRIIPRLWCVWLVGINVACVWFIPHIEAQLVLAVTTIAVAGQTLIYQRIGFTRILGSTHILWVRQCSHGWQRVLTQSSPSRPWPIGWSCCSPRS